MGNNTEINKEKITNNNFLKVLNEGIGIENFSQVSVDKVEKNYYDLFGTKPKHQDFGRCPDYFYDETNKVYYVGGSCGGLSGVENLIYINKIVEKGNEYYAYVSYGKNAGDIYSSYDQKNVVKKITGDEEYKIDETNYDKFSEYKVTFIREDSNYFYKSIERTK